MISFFDKSPIQPKCLYINALTSPLRLRGVAESSRKGGQNESCLRAGELTKGDLMLIGIGTKIRQETGQEPPDIFLKFFSAGGNKIQAMLKSGYSVALVFCCSI